MAAAAANIGILDGMAGALRRLFRSHPSSDATTELFSAVGRGGLDPITGVDTSERAVMAWPAVLQAMRLISESIAMLPISLYERTASGTEKIREASEHSLHAILRDTPNAEQTSFELRRELVMNALFRGNGPAQLLRDGRGNVTEIWPMDPRRTEVQRINGKLVYTYRDEQGKAIRLLPEEVSHLKGFSDGGLIGYAISTQAYKTFGKGLALDEFGGRIFGNGTSLGGILETDSSFKDQTEREAYLAAFNKMHRGVKNSGGNALLDFGIKYRTVGVNAQEAQMLEALRFQVQEIARLFNVPPSMLMDLSNASLNNTEQMALQFLTFSLGPWITNLEQRWNRDLLLPAERSRYFIKLNVDAILRTDMKTRAEALSIATGRPWMTVDEARDVLDRNPILGGDKLMIPANMLNPGGNPDTTTGPAPEPVAPTTDGESDTPRAACCEHEHRTDIQYRNAGRDGYVTAERMREIREANPVEQGKREVLKETYAAILADAALKVSKQEINYLDLNAMKFLFTDDLDQFALVLKGYYQGPEYAALVDRLMGGTYRQYAEAMAKSVGRELGLNEFTLNVSGYTDAYLEAMIKRTGGAHNNQLLHWADELKKSGADIQTALDGQLEKWREQWPDAIGRNESARFGESVVRIGYREAGVTKIAWVANAGACELCQELDGKIVGIEASFLESGEMVGTGAGGTEPLKTVSSIFHPPLHRGCGCGLSPL